MSDSLMSQGDRVSHFEVLEKVGEGGMGEVFLAEDTILQRRVALKFLAFVENELQAQQILDEARSAASIDHPYVCKVFETGEYKGKPFIAMEYLEGQTLRQRLQAGPILLQEALKFATEISEALAEAHEKQIVHCDLKPGNVMIARSGHVKLMDFGLARRGARIPSGDGDPTIMLQPVAVVGTPGYMAPEQSRGEKLDSRADVFPLGVILFEMLTGANPFRRNTPETTLTAVLEEEPPPIDHLVPDVPAFLREILQRAMSKRPSQRYRSANEFCAELMRLQNDVAGSRPVEAPTAGKAAKPAIAVLPFVDLSLTRDQEYFCDGLAEDLITALGQLEDVRVPSRTASFRFKNKDVNLREVGQALDVTLVLEGSVRRAGDRLRISVKLVSTETGYPLWSERFDRLIDDVFDIQDEISRTVAGKVKGTFSLPAHAVTETTASQSSPVTEEAAKTTALKTLNLARPEPPNNVRAYEMYLRGRHFWNMRTEQNLLKSIEQFQEALTEDPEYALAYSGLADAYVTLALYGAAKPETMIDKAREASNHALRIHPNLSEALTSSACLSGVYDWDWPAAIQKFETAIQMNPRYAQAHQWFAVNCLAPRGDFARAREELQQAVDIDPLSLPAATSLGVLEFWERNYDQAISRLQAVIQQQSGFGIGRYFLGQVYLAQSVYDRAIAELESAVNMTGRSPETVCALGCAYAGSGQRRKAMDMLEELWRNDRERYVSPVLVGQLQLALQHEDLAVAELEKAYRLRSTDLVWLAVRPAFDRIRTHPRVLEMLKSMGLV